MALPAITNLVVTKNSDGTYNASWSADVPADEYILQRNGTTILTTTSTTATSLVLSLGDVLTVQAEALSPSDPYTIPTTTPPPPGNGIPYIAGVWALDQFASAAAVTAAAAQIKAALAIEGVVGLSARVTWNSICSTSASTVDTSILAAAKAEADAAGKKFAIRFISGADTPAAFLGNSVVLGSSPAAGKLIPLPWGAGSTPTSFVPNTVFENAFKETVTELAAWSRANDTHELHLPWFSAAWAEIYLNTEIEKAPGYSLANFLEGHERLFAIGQALAGDDLTVEYPFSGYGTNVTDGPLLKALVASYGPYPANMVVQLNNLSDGVVSGPGGSGGVVHIGTIFQGRQMDSPVDYNWTTVFATCTAEHDVTLEIYLQSFASGLAHHSVLLTGIAAYAKLCAAWNGSEPGV